MERVTLRMPKAQVDRVENLVDSGTYPNRSEAIRDAVRKLTREYDEADSGPDNPYTGSDERSYLRTDGCGARYEHVRQRVEDLDPTNDLGYLLGLVDDALEETDQFETDFERAAWVVAQWMQEMQFEPDLSEWPTGQTVSKGPVPKREDPVESLHRTCRPRTDGGLVSSGEVRRDEVRAQRREGQRADQGGCPHVSAVDPLPCARCFVRGGSDG